MVTREGGAQPGEYLAKYMADRVRTVGSTFLGSTMNCCECHDHKYDPFSAKDFYSMGAFFADVKQWGVYMDYAYTPNKDLIGWSNDSPFPPELIVDSPYLKRRQASLFRQIDQIADRSFHASGDTGHEAFSHWQSQANAFLAKHPDGWAVVSPVGLQANQNTPPDTQPVATLSSDNAVLVQIRYPRADGFEESGRNGSHRLRPARGQPRRHPPRTSPPRIPTTAASPAMARQMPPFKSPLLSAPNPESRRNCLSTSPTPI